MSAYDIPVGRLAWLPAGMSRPHTFTWKYATFEANGRDSIPFDHLARRHQANSLPERVSVLTGRVNVTKRYELVNVMYVSILAHEARIRGMMEEF